MSAPLCVKFRGLQLRKRSLKLLYKEGKWKKILWVCLNNVSTLLNIFRSAGAFRKCRRRCLFSTFSSFLQPSELRLLFRKEGNINFCPCFSRHSELTILCHSTLVYSSTNVQKESSRQLFSRLYLPFSDSQEPNPGRPFDMPEVFEQCSAESRRYSPGMIRRVKIKIWKKLWSTRTSWFIY